LFSPPVVARRTAAAANHRVRATDHETNSPRAASTTRIDFLWLHRGFTALCFSMHRVRFFPFFFLLFILFTVETAGPQRQLAAVHTRAMRLRLAAGLCAPQNRPFQLVIVVVVASAQVVLVPVSPIWRPGATEAYGP